MTRKETFQAWWMDENNNDLAQIELVRSGAGQLEMNSNADLKLGGSLTVVDIPSWVNPLRHRARIQATINGEVMSLGHYMIDVETVQYAARRGSSELLLLDQLKVPTEDLLSAPYSVGKGANIVAAAVDVLKSCGETRVAVTPSDAVLATPQVWEPGETKLQVINDLLAIANYWGLRTDSNGYFVFAPYLLPENRPVVREFVAGDGSLMKAEYTRTNNYSGVPNRFLAVSAEYEGKEEKSNSTGFDGLVGVAELTNNDSPYSYDNRGGRWVTQSDQVEAATQKDADAIAARRLNGLLTPVVALEVEHALFPELWLDRKVRVVPSNGDPFTGTITEMTIPLKAGGLVSGGWREVIPLEQNRAGH